MKKEFKMLIVGVLFAAAINLLISSEIYRIMHKDKTNLEIWLHIPKSFIWNFK